MKLKTEYKVANQTIGHIYRIRNENQWEFYGELLNGIVSDHFSNSKDVERWLLANQKSKLTFGWMLDNDIQKSGLSYDDVAYDIKVKRQSVHNWINDKTPPKVVSLVRLAKCLAYDMDWEEKYIKYSLQIVEDSK